MDVLASIDQQRADLLPNQGIAQKRLYCSLVCVGLVSINHLLKQPGFRLAEDVLKNERRPINVRLESGKSAHQSFPFVTVTHVDLTAPPTHRLFPITL